ncbi:MAG TPA: septal ring lytic transglycosylase RlpA family protein [Flavipsychrobacter sp.]|nr:septal ring lytic transglycosylase RlpA family protein [Flavipsychrobacter sp.]
MRKLKIILLLLTVSLGANAQNKIEKFATDLKNGIASFYHDKFEGRKTATGEVFDNDKYTAACNTLKLGSYVKVTNVKNGEVCYVKINDRMAAHNNRLIDLASIAAKQLNFHKNGLAKVKVEVVSEEEGKKAILAQTEGTKAGSATL